jgi:ATP-binding protein involved in chromosome partitioning
MVKIAVPVANQRFCDHFGGAEAFAFYEADEQARKILSKTVVAAPPHERGIFPKWLRSQGATVVLAGGMGPRAEKMFEAYRIQAVLGVNGPSSQPDALVEAYLQGTLVTGENLHDAHHRGHGHQCDVRDEN